MGEDEKFIARARGLFTFDEEGDCVGSPGFLQIAKALAAAEREGEAKAREEEREACAQVLDDLDFRPAHHDEQVQVCMEGAGADALIAAAAAIRAATSPAPAEPEDPAIRHFKKIVDARKKPEADLIEAMARRLCFQGGHLDMTCSTCHSPADCRDWNAGAFRYRQDATDLAAVMLERMRAYRKKPAPGPLAGLSHERALDPDVLDAFKREHGLQ